MSNEKSPLKSKKFLAYQVFNLSLLALGAGILAWAWNLEEISARVFFLMLAIIVISGFVAVGYIIGQAGLDRYVRLAQIAIDGVNGNGSANQVLEEEPAEPEDEEPEDEEPEDEEPEDEEPDEEPEETP